MNNGPVFDSANNGSLVFDGSNDYVDFDDILDIGVLSVNLWVNFDQYNLGREFYSVNGKPVIDRML